MAIHPALRHAARTKTAEKWSPLKGGLPLATLAGGLLLYHGLKGSQQNDLSQESARRDMQRAGEARSNAGVVSSLRGGSPLDPVGAAIYNNERAASGDIGNTFMFDKGAAIHIVQAGRALAKQAGIGGALLGAVNKLPNAALKGVQAVAKPVVSRLPSPGMGTKLLGGAAALGVGYGALKAGKGLYNYGMQPSAPMERGGHNAPLPGFVNQFGVPEMG